jgi:hypothetical protein
MGLYEYGDGDWYFIPEPDSIRESRARERAKRYRETPTAEEREELQLETPPVKGFWESVGILTSLLVWPAGVLMAVWFLPWQGWAGLLAWAVYKVYRTKGERE